MSVDMEQAEPLADVAQFDQEGYQLDLDAGVESNDIHIELESYDTDVQYEITDPDNDFPNQTDDFEIGFDEGDVGPDEPHQDHVESSHHQEVSADGNVEYDDEIGYDDEDGRDGGTTGPATEAADSPAPQAVSDQLNLDGESHATNAQEVSLDQSYGDVSLPEDHADGNDIAVLNGGNPVVQESSHDLAGPLDKLGELASSNEGLEHIDEASDQMVETSGQIVDASVDAPNVPYIEVLYRDSQYSLFGSMEDDPDSFFLSEPKYLDSPLGEFLDGLRHVLGDEISLHDELTIRIPSLDLEFGERSRESLLHDYNLREIHECWSHMFSNGVEETDYMVVHLVTFPEPQHRLDSLLQDIGISHVSARWAASKLTPQEQEEMGFDDSKDGGSTRAYTETNVGNLEDNFEDNFEENFEEESAVVSKHDSTKSPVKVQEPTTNEVYDVEEAGSLDIGPAEEYSLEKAEEDGAYFDEFPMADGDETGDNIEDREFPEADDHMSPEIGDNYADDAILADVEVTTTGEAEVSVIDAGVEPVSESYDDEINVELGGDPTAPQQSSAEPDLHEAQEQNGYYDHEDAATTDQQGSNHTSATSTIDGDEIDYEDNTADDGDFVINVDDHQEPTLDVGDGDEIDWRNDEDDEEAAALPTADSPSSVSVKRSRTDDADDLVDEADHKRRRT